MRTGKASVACKPVCRAVRSTRMRTCPSSSTVEAASFCSIEKLSQHRCEQADSVGKHREGKESRERRAPLCHARALSVAVLCLWQPSRGQGSRKSLSRKFLRVRPYPSPTCDQLCYTETDRKIVCCSWLQMRKHKPWTLHRVPLHLEAPRQHWASQVMTHLTHMSMRMRHARRQHGTPPTLVRTD